MEPGNAAEELQQKYPQLLEGFHRVLNEHGMGHLAIQGIEFAHRETLDLKTDRCPPGSIAKQVCFRKPGGGIHCITTCVPSGRI
jgi:hypothetical protein